MKEFLHRKTEGNEKTISETKNLFVLVEVFFASFDDGLLPDFLTLVLRSLLFEEVS